MQENSKAKKPLHEALSFRLAVAIIGLGSEPSSPEASEISLILQVLGESKMKAKDAREIAEVHHELPEHLRIEGQPDLANLADEVLKDLMGREDEPKKQEKPEPVHLSDTLFELRRHSAT